MPIRIRTGAAVVLFLCAPLYAQGDPQAVAEIDRAFRNHRFDPSILALFDRRRLDPLIVDMEWEGVRRHVEDSLRRLNTGIRPIDLPCTFRPLPDKDDPKDGHPYRLLPVFIFEKGNTRAKSVLKQVLNLRDDAVWDYEPERGRVIRQKPVQETVITTTGDFKPRFLKGNTLDLVQVHIGLQEVVSEDDNALKKHHLQPLPAHIMPARGLHFATVWKLHWKSRYTAIGWRLKAILERNEQPDTWELVAKVEIGKRYASQADYSVIGDSMKGHLLGEQMHIAIRHGKSTVSWGGGKTHLVDEMFPIPSELAKAGVDPPIERVRAEEVTAFDNLGTTLAELCRNKLLAKAEKKR